MKINKCQIWHKGQLANNLYLNMNSGSKPLRRILTIITVDEIWHPPWPGEELGASNLDLNPVYGSQSVYMFLASKAHSVLPGFGLTSESGFWIQNSLYNSYHQNSKTVHGFGWHLTHGSILEYLFTPVIILLCPSYNSMSTDLCFTYQTVHATQCVISVVQGVGQLVHTVIGLAVAVETHTNCNAVGGETNKGTGESLLNSWGEFEYNKTTQIKKWREAQLNSGTMPTRRQICYFFIHYSFAKVNIAIQKERQWRPVRVAMWSVLCEYQRGLTDNWGCGLKLDTVCELFTTEKNCIFLCFSHLLYPLWS